MDLCVFQICINIHIQHPWDLILHVMMEYIDQTYAFENKDVSKLKIAAEKSSLFVKLEKLQRIYYKILIINFQDIINYHFRMSPFEMKY